MKIESSPDIPSPRISQVAPEPPVRRLLRALKSAAAAAFGVQSNANRVRDFQSDSIVPFLVAGLIVTVVLVVGLMALVSNVID